jgi:hypothetical protein
MKFSHLAIINQIKKATLCDLFHKKRQQRDSCNIIHSGRTEKIMTTLHLRNSSREFNMPGTKHMEYMFK